jgi:hypothetical protein
MKEIAMYSKSPQGRSTTAGLFVLTFAGLLACTPSVGVAKDLYVAQNATGGDTGANCSNPHSAAWFNTSGNWGSGSSQIAPGDKVHLCGTFTGTAGQTMLTTGGDGVAGSPITLLMEPGTMFVAPYWGDGYMKGAINIPNSYIVLDGGANGMIRNTANGTPGAACLAGCSFQHGSMGVWAGGSNVTVQNLIVQHMYMHSEGINDALGEDSGGVQICGSGSVAKNNTIDNTYNGVALGCTNVSNIEIAFNRITLCNHCVKVGINAGTVSGLRVHDNDLSDAYVWDQPDNHYHHNGIFAFGDPAGTIIGEYYNNYIHGIFSRDVAYGGSHTTALIFLENDNQAKIYNNIFTLDTADVFGASNGYIMVKQAKRPQEIYNNTFYDPGHDSICIRGDGGPALTLKNNIFKGCWFAVSWEGSFPSVASDYNDLFGSPAPQWTYSTNTFISFDQWKLSCSGCDTHSLTVDPLLDSNFRPQNTALDAGVNLVSLGVSALNLTKDGIARPVIGSWTMGAMGRTATQGTLAAPTGMAAVVVTR